MILGTDLTLSAIKKAISQPVDLFVYLICPESIQQDNQVLLCATRGENGTAVLPDVPVDISEDRLGRRNLT